MCLFQQESRNAFLEQTKLHAGEILMVFLEDVAAFSVLFHCLSRMQLQDVVVCFLSELEKFEVLETELGWSWVFVYAGFAVAEEPVFLQKSSLTFGFRLLDETRP